MNRSTFGPIRLDPKLIALAKKEGSIKKRSVPKQIEYWAELGKAVASAIDLKDVYAIIQGFCKLNVETLESNAVDPNKVFDSLEKKRKSGKLSKKVTTSSIYFEASQTKPGLLDRVDTTTGKRQTGRFHNGKFEIYE
ncbi:hypothetical protein MNBD_NITROSPIRAE03-1944 [hydrothermal vent metagenome]|uniref:ParD-like antitoxin of type II toxin-antitoxin system n=1 Tax=hydrothermal vent metagenome TaxID=652676 RepID=A0A3B1CWS6_9ZZZZ